MRAGRLLLLAISLFSVQLISGCGSSQPELPTKEKIDQQLKRDAAMREAEDRLEKEKSAKKTN